MKRIRKTIRYCKNCGTSRFKIVGGYCSRCSYCIKKIAKLKKADPKVPSSLVGAIPKGGNVTPDDPTIIHGYGPGYWATQFQKDQGDAVREFQTRLRHLKETEECLQGNRPISNLHILRLLRQLARWCGCPRNRKILKTAFNDLAENFTPEQKLFLYRWLNEISENTSRRWKLFHANFRWDNAFRQQGRENRMIREDDIADNFKGEDELIAKLYLREPYPKDKSCFFVSAKIFCSKRKCKKCPHGPFLFKYKYYKSGALKVEYKGTPFFDPDILEEWKLKNCVPSKSS